MLQLAFEQPLTLPCGATLKNRLGKAAMTEGLATPLGSPTPRHATLYEKWARGGAGLLITGNIQVDGRYLERPGNVVIDGPQSEAQLAALREYASSCTRGDTHTWVQLSHAGRQTPKIIAPEPVGPSAIPMALPGGLFGTPRALETGEIERIIERFAHAARVCQEVGFTGVQIHSAHGYLLSEFLNPRANQRTDQWGGSLKNRARLLLQTVTAVREAVGPSYPVSVKLNSSDFQRGGYTFTDCQQVAAWLDEANIDLLEISGGNYEQPRMMKLAGLEPVTESDLKESTQAGISERTEQREAYFVEYARAIASEVKTPLMVTGGFRSRVAMQAALESGAADIIGLARPLCVEPDAPRQLLSGKVDALPKWEESLALGSGWLGPSSRFDLIKALNGMSTMAFYYRNLDLLADNRPTVSSLGLFGAFVRLQLSERKKATAIRHARHD